MPSMNHAFQGVISFVGNSEHHKQNGKGARMSAFFMAGFVKKYESGAIKPLFHARHGILLSRAETPSCYRKPCSAFLLLA